MILVRTIAFTVAAASLAPLLMVVGNPGTSQQHQCWPPPPILNQTWLANDRTDTHKTTAAEAAASSCSVWLAPSSIPGAGIGLFAGRTFSAGQGILTDLAIAIVDIEQHNAHKFYIGEFVWNDYTWTGTFCRMSQEGHHRVDVVSEGSMNCFMGLDNVRAWYPRLGGQSTPPKRRRSNMDATDTEEYDDMGVSNNNSIINTHSNTSTLTHTCTSTNVGSGAQTQFHHRQVTALHDIAAGDELFVNYGSHYFRIRRHLATVPLLGDLEKATRLLMRFTALQTTLQRRHGHNGSDHLAWDLWHRFITGTAFRDSRVLQGVLNYQSGTNNSVVNGLSNLQLMHGSNVTTARRAASHRSVSTLRGDTDQRGIGICTDHIVGRPSTLPYAGMGAFATRALPRGELVAHLPMVPIADRGRLEMFHLHREASGDWTPINDTVVGHQLLLNYCYGHAESTLLLCPYSPHVNYINHNQTLANVRIEWSHQDRVWLGDHKPEFLNASIDSIAYAGPKTKLSMDLLATRDIQAGEEVLLDYGNAWEVAWQAHVKRSRPATRLLLAEQLQSDKGRRLRTVFEELDEQRYSDKTKSMCDCACLWKPYEVQMNHQAGTLDAFLWDNQAEWWPCTILRTQLDENHSGEYLYTVHILEDATTTAELSSRLGTIVNHVPREIIHFVDQPYSSDIYRRHAFRHHICIPDAMFPLAWRNRQP